MTAAELADLDPAGAALRILGGALCVDGIDARIVEVEAYGGPPDGRGRIRRRTPSGA